MGEATSYDAVEYPASSYPTTHPSHLAALAALHGLSAPDPQTCRVLEIAGGDGINLAAMAAGLPQAHLFSGEGSIGWGVAPGTASIEGRDPMSIETTSYRSDGRSAQSIRCASQSIATAESCSSRTLAIAHNGRRSTWTSS